MENEREETVFLTLHNHPELELFDYVKIELDYVGLIIHYIEIKTVQK